MDVVSGSSDVQVVGRLVEVDGEVGDEEDEEEETVNELQSSDPLHQTDSTRHERTRHAAARIKHVLTRTCTHLHVYVH